MGLSWISPGKLSSVGGGQGHCLRKCWFLPELSVVGGEGPHFSKKEWCELVSQEGMPGALMASLIRVSFDSFSPVYKNQIPKYEIV